nr:methyltransferase domain-containing protein [Bauldia sp.]
MKGAVVTGSVAADLREVTGGAELGLARDRVAQAYLGEWGGARTIERVRNRIHWLAAAVRGTTVLDVGTSEGILPILLAREGFRAHGIDTNAGAIAFARTLVAAEAEAVRERITLVEESLVDHAPAAPYDTVVVGEVIEHVGNPAGFVDRALALVVEGGRLVLTTPYGILPDRDHRHSLYLSDIRDLAATRGTVEALDVVDGYIRLVLRKGAVATDADHAGLLSERRLLALSEDAAHAAGVVLHHGLDELRGAVSGLSEDLAAAGESLSEALAAQAGVEAELVASRDERTRLAAAVADRDRTIESLRAEEARLVRRIAEAQAMATARESEAKADRARIAGLERILAGVRAGVAAAVPEGERIALVHPSHGPTIALAFEPVTFAVAPVPGRYLEIRIVFAEGGMPRDRRDSVVLVRCLDAAGAVIAPPYRGLQFSPKTGAYRYLDPARVEAGQGGSVLSLLRIPQLWPIFAMMFVCYALAAALRGLWLGPYF